MPCVKTSIVQREIAFKVCQASMQLLNCTSGGSTASHRFDNLLFGGGRPDGFLGTREEISRGAV